jgi:probable rRNA maturation factor
MMQFITETSYKLPFKKKNLILWIKNVASSKDIKVGNLNYVFVSIDKIVEVNVKYLKHSYPTDIITFDYTKKSVISGDIFISPEVVEGNAKDFNVSFEDEMLRVIIHGVLHLCGINDLTKEESDLMRIEEDRAIAVYKMMFNVI